MNNPWQEEVIELLEQCQASVYDLLLYILRSKLSKHAAQRDILHAQTHNVMDLWSEQYPLEVEEWAIKASMEAYRQEIVLMTQQQAGFHFKSTRASLSQLENFSMVDMGRKLRGMVPKLWQLLGVMLDANTEHRRAKLVKGQRTVQEDVDVNLGEIGGEESSKMAAKEDWDKLFDTDNESECSSDSDSEDGSPSIATNPSQVRPSHPDTSSSTANLTSTPLAPGQSESSDDDVDDREAPRNTKRRRRKQNAAKRNAVLLAIVSTEI